MRKVTYTLPCGNTYFVRFAELLDEPVVLIAGATGSGKSVVLEHLIRTLLLTKFPICGHPSGAQLWIADPKKVELNEFKDLPHTRNGGRYENTLKGILRMLADLEGVMDARFQDMERRGLRKWDGSHIYLLIDELADLMISAKKETTAHLIKLTQLCRAAGIHIIACTQCPNRTVITAPIQCNVTAAIALRCKTAIESRQIVGIAGAEALPKHGRVMIANGCEVNYMSVPMIDRDELKEVEEHWMRQNRGWGRR